METSRGYRRGIGLGGPGCRIVAGEDIDAAAVGAAGIVVEERCTGFEAAGRSSTPGEGEDRPGRSFPVARVGVSK